MRTILLAGGGTLGPVTPLLAAASRMREMRPGLRFAWAGTDRGPEREVVERAGIPFFIVPTAKLPRYLSWKLVMAPFDYVRARREAGRFLNHIRPSLVMSAGGFTAVPVTLEAAGRGLPCIAHQLDYTPGLSNRLAAKHCRYVTTSFEYPVSPFGTRVVTYRVPTPARYALGDLASRASACGFFGFNPSLPVVLVMGGGTGAKALNEAIASLQPQIQDRVQILHLTGAGKATGMNGRRWHRPHHHVGSHMPMGNYQAATVGSSYLIAEFLGDEMPIAYAAADIVVSRAGVGAIAELAALRKPTILVPLPDSPQEANVKALGDAVRVVEQSRADFSDHLLWTIEKLLEDTDARKRLGMALHETFPTDQGEALASLALSVLV